MAAKVATMVTVSQPSRLFTDVPPRLHTGGMSKTLSEEDKKLEDRKRRGELVRVARKAKGLSQDALGAMMDPPLGKQGIYKLEKGVHLITARLASQLSAALGISAQEIVEGEFLLSGDGGAAKPSKSPATFTLSDDVFRACFEPLVYQFAGKKLATGLEADFYAKTNRDLHEAMTYLRAHEPSVSLTSHLSQFLILALGSMLGANPLSNEFDYPRWRKATDAAATLALTLMEDDGGPRRKSG